MTKASLTAAIALGALAMAAVSPAKADPTITEAFLANVKPNVRFLEQSSKVALASSKAAAWKSASARAYVQGMLSEANKTLIALDDTQSLRLASLVPTSGDALPTGRSVAVEPQSGLGQAANGRQPLGQKDVDALTRLSGRAFVDAFWLKQVDALSQLRADYRDYAEHGDDAALVAMSKRQLAVVEHELTLLAKI